MAGKGDSPRPLSVSVEEFRRRFERIFEAAGNGGPRRSEDAEAAGERSGGPASTEGPSTD